MTTTTKIQFSIEKALLFLGLFNILYFGFMIYTYYYPINSKDARTVQQFFVELMTLPLMFSIIASFFFGIFKIFKTKHIREYATILAINLGLIVFLGYQTYLDYAQ